MSYKESKMKIAIAKKSQVDESWVMFIADDKTPCEIRADILSFLKKESKYDLDHKIVTMNITILNMISNKSEDHNISYEDVYVYCEENSNLVSLLEIHSEDYLSHFALGDLLEYNDLKKEKR
jgi:hypothetical protein